MSYLKIALEFLEAQKAGEKDSSPEPQSGGNHIPAVEPPLASPPERILTCYECPLHEHDRINPPEGWGHCTLRDRGCYGLRSACPEGLAFDGKRGTN